MKPLDDQSDGDVKDAAIDARYYKWLKAWNKAHELRKNGLSFEEDKNVPRQRRTRVDRDDPAMPQNVHGKLPKDMGTSEKCPEL